MIQYIIRKKPSNEVSIIRKTQQGDEHTLNVEETELFRIDEYFLTYRYGLKLHEYELSYFKANIIIWKDFQYQNDDWCLITEDNVGVDLEEYDWTDLLSQLHVNTDVFFPFDPTSVQDKIELQPSIQGYYWGSHIYLLSKSGMAKLISNAVIRQPLDEEILMLSANGKLRTFHSDTGFFSMDLNSSPSFVARHEILSATLASWPAWSDENKKTAQKLLRILSQIADECNVKLVLHGGTLLGAIRHGEIMAWDDDIDLGINVEDINTLLDGLSKCSDIKWTKWLGEFRGNKSVYYKVWLLDEGEEIKGYEYKFPFVDIWLYFIDGESAYYKEWPAFSKDLYLPLRTTFFEGSNYYVPANSLGFLDFLFNDWREYIVVYPYCHRLETYTSHKWKCRISTDSQGRISHREHNLLK